MTEPLIGVAVAVVIGIYLVTTLVWPERF